MRQIILTFLHVASKVLRQCVNQKCIPYRTRFTITHSRSHLYSVVIPLSILPALLQSLFCIAYTAVHSKPLSSLSYCQVSPSTQYHSYIKNSSVTLDIRESITSLSYVVFPQHPIRRLPTLPFHVPTACHLR